MTDEPRLVQIEETSILKSEDGEIFQVGVWPPGSSVSSYLHTQSSAASVWTVNHNLGYRGNVEIRSPGGEVVCAEVLHISVNQVQITFASPQSGTARVI